MVLPNKKKTGTLLKYDLIATYSNRISKFICVCLLMQNIVNRYCIHCHWAKISTKVFSSTYFGGRELF